MMAFMKSINHGSDGKAVKTSNSFSKIKMANSSIVSLSHSREMLVQTKICLFLWVIGVLLIKWLLKLNTII